MKLSEQWLRTWVDPANPIQHSLAQLTQAGHEVERYGPVAGTFSQVVVGQIKTLEKHPDAKRLHVCTVDVGQAELLSIVCGGTNLAVDLKVPVALVGAVLPDELHIKETVLRGVLSQGMICASSELGLGESSQGQILILDREASLGASLVDCLKLNDCQLEVAITPNRGDCLSIQGLARELAALSQTPLTPPVQPNITPTVETVCPVNVTAPKQCARYLGRVIDAVKLNAETPVWLAERLRRSGIRSLDPIVDVINYVMLELGQPMHAFDLRSIKQGIKVRLAKAEETVTLLDDTQITLTETDLVIADSDRVLALAGIMGAKHSGVSQTTHSILLESAYFDPQTVARTLRRTGLLSESAHRFERGVDFAGQAVAMERATELLLQIVGGQAGPILEAVDPEHLPHTALITLRHKRIQQLLGLEVTAEQVVTLLTSLNLQLEAVSEGWQVTVPSYRCDLQQEINLIEEVARLYGLERIPAIPLKALLALQPLPVDLQKTERLSSLQQVLCQRGYREAVNYSFVSPPWQAILFPDTPCLNLTNPISNDLSAMRLSLWPGLLQAIQYNQHRQQPRLRLFSSGLCFVPEAESLQQTMKLAGVHAGEVLPEQWGVTPRPIDFFDIKADVSALLESCVDQLEFRVSEHPALHPNQSADIIRAGQVIGQLGLLHPAIKQQLKLEGSIALFELTLAAIPSQTTVSLTPVSKFPAIRRDLAVVVNETVVAASLLAVLRKEASEYYTDSFVFDVYQGAGIEQGKKSVAMGLILQETSRTLQDEEVNAVMDRILQRLQKDYGAELRQ